MTRPPLSALQSLFQNRIQSGDADSERAMEAMVVSDVRAGAGERVAVYADAYRLRLTEAMSVDYPALCSLLGVPEFSRMCRAYIAAYPSDRPSIRWFGRYLSVFLAGAPDYSQRPVLSELAAFEWAQGETFDALDAPVLNIEQVAAIAPTSWAGMRLLPHPSVRRLDLYWNAPEIVKAVSASKRRPASRQTAKVTPWLMWRDEKLDIRWRSIGDDEVAAFDAARNNQRFADICELLCEFVEPEQAPMQAAGLLKRWVMDGLITDIDIA